MAALRGVGRLRDGLRGLWPGDRVARIQVSRESFVSVSSRLWTASPAFASAPQPHQEGQAQLPGFWEPVGRGPDVALVVSAPTVPPQPRGGGRPRQTSQGRSVPPGRWRPGGYEKPQDARPRQEGTSCCEWHVLSRHLPSGRAHTWGGCARATDSLSHRTLPLGLVPGRVRPLRATPGLCRRLCGPTPP